MVWPVKLIRMVSPSGLLLATISAAMLPPAPALFSTTTGRFRTWPMTSLMVRASVSVVPPAGAPTMIFKGRSCACAAGANAAAAEDAKAKVASDLPACFSQRRRGPCAPCPPLTAPGMSSPASNLTAIAASCIFMEVPVAIVAPAVGDRVAALLHEGAAVIDARLTPAASDPIVRLSPPSGPERIEHL